ncbi:ice-binding family protein [Kitasatospora sp. NPDC006697]|uniref:ice-binding family protein n=1 Tax=Kitasatospora sp. NPDC006697 TaxID=3364020 RepID=UPI003691F2F7
MTLNFSAAPHWHRTSAWIAGIALIAASAVALTPGQAQAIATAVPLGTADSFAVLAGQSVSNTGSSVITGDVGVSPGTAISGFPPGMVNGTIHSADAVAAQAQNDLTTAYNDAASEAPDATISADLGGQTLIPGVYNSSTSLGLTGTLTLDAQGDPNAVWVFQAGSTLTTASASRVILTNGAAPCNVFWQIGSSATLGTSSTFVGNILALTSITATTGASIDGRALARNGSVTLDTNRITRETCAAGSTGGTTTGTTGGTTTGTTGGTTTGTTGGTGAATGGTGATTGGLIAGPTGGLLGGVIAGGTTGATTAGATAGVTAGATGGETGGVTAGATGGGTGGECGHCGDCHEHCKPCGCEHHCGHCGDCGHCDHDDHCGHCDHDDHCGHCDHDDHCGVCGDECDSGACCESANS